MKQIKASHPRRLNAIRLLTTALLIVWPGRSLFSSPVNVNFQLPVDGLAVVYCNSTNLTEARALQGTSVSDIVPNLDFKWRTVPPSPGISAKRCAARFCGTLTAPKDGTFTFYLTHDSGVRFWLDGQLLVDQWTN